MPIYIFRVSSGREKSVAKLAYQKATAVDMYAGAIQSIIYSDLYKGYIFIEGPTQQRVESVMEKIRGVGNRPIQNKNVDLDDLKNILLPKSATTTLKVGDTVDIINGPFKGSRAIITRVDEANEEVTAEISSSALNLPLKLHADYVKKVADAE